jgi:hypothetical protein
MSTVTKLGEFLSNLASYDPIFVRVTTESSGKIEVGTVIGYYVEHTAHGKDRIDIQLTSARDYTNGMHPNSRVDFVNFPTVRTHHLIEYFGVTVFQSNLESTKLEFGLLEQLAQGQDLKST